MNPNDILQQQQAMIDQMMHRSEQVNIIALIVMLIATGISAWVLYMFYRCQRDTADELRKIRTAYQFEINRRLNPAQPTIGVLASGENPFAASTEDEKYRPK